jgi:DNA polymerase-3 subunit beta
MRLSVSKDEMQEKLSNVQNIVEKKNTMPILSHFLLDAGKKDSYIVATDLETAIKEPVTMKVEEPGKLCIPARKLFEIVREMDGDLSVEAAGEPASGGGWLKVKAGTSEFKLACLSASEFPAWPAMEDEEEIIIDAKVLMEMIEKTIYSAGESDTRYTLNGLLFHIQPKSKALTVVGTDGHRLALIVKEMDEEGKEEKRLIVPRKAVSELRKFLNDEAEKIKIMIGKNHLLFSVGREVQFLTRLIEGTYPNYENVIPQANEKKVSINREAFVKALRRVSVMSRERANAVRFDFDLPQADASGRNLVISSSNPDLGEAREEIAVDYKGDKLTLGFNARYLIDTLGAMTAEMVVLELQDPLSPVLLKEEGREDYRCVVMPMRI